MDDEQIIRAMERFGGGFVKELAKLWRHADSNNKRRLRLAFDDYFEQYVKFVPALPDGE